MRNAQQTAVESYKIYYWRKKTHMAGRLLISVLFISSVLAQWKILYTALSITWFSIEMSDLVARITSAAYNSTGRQIVFSKCTQTSSEISSIIRGIKAPVELNFSLVKWAFKFSCWLQHNTQILGLLDNGHRQVQHQLTPMEHRHACTVGQPSEQLISQCWTRNQVNQPPGNKYRASVAWQLGSDTLALCHRAQKQSTWSTS